MADTEALTLAGVESADANADADNLLELFMNSVQPDLQLCGDR